jgi:hypothetical protein
MLKLQLFASVLQCVAVCCSVLQVWHPGSPCHYGARGVLGMSGAFLQRVCIYSLLCICLKFGTTHYKTLQHAATLSACASNLATLYICLQVRKLQMSKGGLHLVMTKGIFWISNFSPMDTDVFTAMAPWTWRWRNKGDSLSVRM